MIVFSLSILVIPFLLFIPAIRLNNKAKRTLHAFTFLYFLFVSWMAFMVNTSLMNENLPWYEPCGMQFLILVVYCLPAMIMIGIVNIILGKFIKILRVSKIFPIIIGLALALPVFIDGSLGYEMQVIGTVISIVGAVGIIIILIKQLINWRKTNDAV